MKNLLVVVSFLISSSLLAKAPKPFDDSSIKRKLKNGSIQSFDGNRYKIVPRTSKSSKKLNKSVSKPISKVRKNRISLLVGSAPKAKIYTPAVDTAKVESKLAIGLQYQRLITEKVSLGVQIQSNESAFGSVGLDF